MSGAPQEQVVIVMLRPGECECTYLLGGPRGRFDHPAFGGCSSADLDVAIIQPLADLFGGFDALAR